MAELPIIFSGAMVRAILAGRKTMTRRILKPQPDPRSNNFSVAGGKWMGVGPASTGRGTAQWDPWRPLRFAAGDRLWVREGFTTRDDGSRAHPRLVPMYAADFEGFDKPHRDWNWSSPIHMPRWASRITLAVTAVKVELLQDITNADAMAEGALESGLPYVGAMTCDQARVAFSLLWDSIHGKLSWEENPYVVAISFRRADG